MVSELSIKVSLSRIQLIGLGSCFVLVGFCVVMGAIGSHIVGRLYPENQTTYDLAVYYATVHAFGMAFLFIVFNLYSTVIRRIIVICFGLGLVCFSGLLVLKSLEVVKPFHGLVPFGGLSYIIGWFMMGGSLLVAAYKKRLEV